ncbi:MAG: ATP-binding cassette domain-containing protein [Halanaerobiales bacterium]|nr:ATP-binding cassette domain-containing protein [Halanaerobiales bacterium]
MLKLNQISKTFNPDTITETQVFSNLNLKVKEDSFITIIGGNGAGKSSMLNLISGQFPPDQGQIFLSGKNITHLKEHQRAKWISRVFQNPLLGTAPGLTVAENLSLALNKGKTLSFKRALHPKKLEPFRQLVAPLNLGLEDKMNLPVKFLSGGQRQALTLLMATIISPKLLLLDEHTAALDPKTAEQVLHLTHQMVVEKKLTTLMVTHNLEQAIKFGDRLIMLHQGKIILDFSGKEKKNLTVSKLFSHFKATSEKSGENLMEDRLLFA